MDQKDLINQAKHGDKESFSKLVLLYQGRIYHYLLSRCQNKHDADDLLQEVFFNAYKYLDSYKSKWKFSTWLFTIASRSFKELTKYKPQLLDITLEQRTDEISEFVINQNNIWLKIRAILKPDAFDVLWFYYVEEKSVKEISKILDMSQSGIKISLFRSRRRLKKEKDIIKISEQYII